MNEATKHFTIRDIHKADKLARERPELLSDAQIELLAEYDADFAAEARERRAEAQEAAARPPVPAVVKATQPAIARWLKGESRAEFEKRCANLPVPLKYVTASDNALQKNIEDVFTAINEKNKIRNARHDESERRIASLEARLAAAEARLGGHSAAPDDEVTAALLRTIDRKVAEVSSQQAIDSERIKALEERPVGLRYLGVWSPSRHYRRDEGVSWAGSLWVCINDHTRAKPGYGADGSRDWQLACKRGSDGKDAKGA